MSHARAGTLESLRRLNRLRVVDALRAEGLISRADIARRTGLSRSTVSSLISDLQADGLVVAGGESSATPGIAPGGARDPLGPSSATRFVVTGRVLLRAVTADSVSRQAQASPARA